MSKVTLLLEAYRSTVKVDQNGGWEAGYYKENLVLLGLLGLLCKLATVLRVSKADGSLSQHLHSGRQFKVWCWLKMGTLEKRDGNSKETV